MKMSFMTCFLLAQEERNKKRIENWERIKKEEEKQKRKREENKRRKKFK